jgi:hypothetical protein
VCGVRDAPSDGYRGPGGDSDHAKDARRAESRRTHYTAELAPTRTACSPVITDTRLASRHRVKPAHTRAPRPATYTRLGHH